jgi:hypothetical protein
MPFGKINSCLLAAVMTAALLPTGCRGHQRPAASEADYYQRWEAETHRQHVDRSQRTRDEQKEYSDWRQKQDDRR